MDIPQQRLNMPLPASRIRLIAGLVLMTAGAGFAGMLCARADYQSAIVVNVVSLIGLFLLTASASVESVLLAWFVSEPLASFYLRYPVDRSVITYDRTVFGLLILVVFLEASGAVTRDALFAKISWVKERRGFSLTKFELAWGFLSVIALASALGQSNNVASAMRIAIDTFCLPLFAFYFARSRVDLRSGGRWLLLGCMALALFLLASGVFELVTGIDLFQYKGADLVREGERRVNGPFAADSSFAIICLLLFLFLRAAPGLVRARIDRSGKVVYAAASAAAAVGALLSLFRVVAFALVTCWILQRWASNRASSKSSRNRSALHQLVPLASLMAVAVIVVGCLMAAMAPSLFTNRLADPRSVFGRLATWQAAAEIALEKPVLGVGLANYAEYFDASHYYSDEAPEEVAETKAADSPHSNILWVASELGLTGLVLYIAANVFLFRMGWRALNRAADSRQGRAAACFLALLVAYWIPGLTLASGYYSDLNLYFLFLLGVLSGQFSDVSPASRQSQSTVEF